MRREVKEGSVFGGAVGVLLWLYDFRHILFGGPPKARISGVIESIIPLDKLCEIGSEGANSTCGFIGKLLILTMAGVLAGMVVAGLLRPEKK